MTERVGIAERTASTPRDDCFVTLSRPLPLTNLPLTNSWRRPEWAAEIGVT